MKRRTIVLIVLESMVLILGIVGVVWAVDHDKIEIGRAYFGFYENHYKVIEKNDSHGGFHGDGLFHISLDCSENTEEAHMLTDGWKSLPLSENLQLIMYGGTKNGVYYAYNLAEESSIPLVKNGYFRFYDKQSESDHADDTNLFGRYSFNIELAIYDAEKEIFYYIKFDT